MIVFPIFYEESPVPFLFLFLPQTIFLPLPLFTLPTSIQLAFLTKVFALRIRTGDSSAGYFVTDLPRERSIIRGPLPLPLNRIQSFRRSVRATQPSWFSQCRRTTKNIFGRAINL